MEEGSLDGLLRTGIMLKFNQFQKRTGVGATLKNEIETPQC
jgi:hypothetical protein